MPGNDVKIILNELIKMAERNEIDAVGIVLQHHVGGGPKQYEIIKVGEITNLDITSAVQDRISNDSSFPFGSN